MNTKAFNGDYEIVDSMTLLAFARSHGKMQLGKFSQADPETNETKEWQSLIFTDSEGQRTFVSVSQKLGTLTPQFLLDNYRELQVIKGNTGNYMVCRQGDNSWETIELPL